MNDTTRITETKPGHLKISCTISSLPYTRTTYLGMFCDSKPCQCEIESQKLIDILQGKLA